MTRTARGRRRLHLAQIAAVVLVAGLAACTTGPSGTTATDAADSSGSSSEPQQGGTLTFAIGTDPISVNPQGGGAGNDARYITRQIVDSLVDQDPETGEIVPWLATSWEINDDATAFTFTLREDVTFSDGTPFTAQSVVDTFEDIIANGALANTAISYFGDYTGASTDGEHTLTVTFSSPNAPFLQALSEPALAPIASASLEQSWEDRSVDGVIGTGPFVLDHYTQDSEVLLVARDDYAWPSPLSENPGAAYLEEVLFQIVPESSVRTGLLSSDQLDVIGSVPPQDKETLESAGYPLISRANPGRSYGLAPYTVDSLASEEAVRLAITHALDRQALRDAALTPDYAVATSVLADTTPGWVDLSELFAYDPAESERLLEEAGWQIGEDGIRARDGERLELVLAWQTNNAYNQTVVELIQQQVLQVGIDLQLVSGTVPEITEGETTGDYDFRYGNLSRADGDVLRTSFSSSIERPFTAAVPELDALLDQQRAIVDATPRNEVLAQAQELILEQGLYVPTHQLTSVLATTAEVHGIVLGADARLGSLSSAWKER